MNIAKLLAESSKFWVLTPRERQVCALIMEGYPNKLVAYELGLSERTVEAHRANIFRKVGVRNAAQLIHSFYATQLKGVH